MIKCQNCPNMEPRNKQLRFLRAIGDLDNVNERMPSVDHCVNKPSEMATITNSLEVFDTYKHREEKDSDEESFHLPLLEDDDAESKPQENAKTGNSGESEEDEILNKFESVAAALDPIDPKLEEHLLNDEEEEKKEKAKTENGVVESGSGSVSDDGSNLMDSDKGEQNTEVTDKTENVENGECESDKKDDEESTSEIKDNNTTTVEEVREKIVDEPEPPSLENKQDDDNNKETEDADKEKSEATEQQPITEDKNTDEKMDEDVPLNENNENPTKGSDETVERMEVDENLEQDKAQNDEEQKAPSKPDSDKNEESSRDSVKNHNEDSEDLFDISVIRDAEEDNAESAYNEAHPEGSEDGEDRNSDKGEEKSEDDTNSDDKTENIEEEEVIIENEKTESEQLKHDDLDIEESTLKLDCDGSSKDISDVDSENANSKSDSCEKVAAVQDTCDKDKEVAAEVVTSDKLMLDEVTGDLVNSDNVPENKDSASEDKAAPKETEDQSDKRQSLKRALSEESDGTTPKKPKTDLIEEEVPKEKPPLKSLLSLSDFMRNKKSNRRLTTQDLEEFCLQKVCEAIAHKSDLGSVYHQLKLQEQLIEAMRKEIQQLTKQARDLEIVNKKLMNDLKQQNATQKPLNPLKITRSVGLQVKFSPGLEANLKRRPLATGQQKTGVQIAPARGPRNIPNNSGTATPNRQVNTPQKQQQQQQNNAQKQPTTPILSQALQSRRVPATNTSQAIRPKPPEAKTAQTPSVIDLTDEDDKKDKNKNSPKTVPAKNIAVPLRTTPVRVNTSAAGIRLTNSQGKITPITSMVTTTSTPQVMYVVQSPGQNVLSSTLGQKAVVVNFQSANGVITSMNGSMIQNKGNTIQLKAVSPAKPQTKVVKLSNKHPAPLPAPPPPMLRVNPDKPLKPIPPKPHLTIRKTDTGIILQWKMPYELNSYEVIASYQLYAYQETSAMPSTDMWRKVGDVKALALPMACTLTQFADKNKYYFAVRPVDIHKRIGEFSEPEEISL